MVSDPVVLFAITVSKTNEILRRSVWQESAARAVDDKLPIRAAKSCRAGSRWLGLEDAFAV